MESTVAQPAIGAVQNISLPNQQPETDTPVAAIPAEEGRLWKVSRILRRRAGLALGLLVTVTAVYLALGLNTKVTYAGQAVVVVPATSPGQLPPGDPDAAAKLAKTYAVAIPLNRDLLTQTATKANTSLSYLKAHLSVTNDLGTSILRIDFAGQTPASTAAALGYLTSRLIATNPPAPVIPGSAKLISVPDSVVRDGGSLIGRLPLGLMLGLIVAVGASYVLETTRPRIDGETECADALGLPVSWLGSERISRMDRLLARLEPFDADSLTLIEVVGADERSSGDSPEVARKLAAAIWRATVQREEREVDGLVSTEAETRLGAAVSAPVAVSVGSLRTYDETDAPTSKVIVLVRQGTPRVTVTLAAKRLLNQDRTPVWGVIGPSRTFRERRAARAAG